MTLQNECIGYDMSIEDFLDSLIPEVPKSIPDLCDTVTATKNYTNEATNNVINVKNESENSLDSDIFLDQLNINNAPLYKTTLIADENTERFFVRNNSMSSNSSGGSSPPMSPDCLDNTLTQNGITMIQQPDSPNSNLSISPTPMTGFVPVTDTQQQDIFNYNQQQGAMLTWDQQKPGDRNYRYDPKPLMRKNKRQLVPNEEKTQKYWQRRQRNNKAARKSREDRRKKELEVLQTMTFLQEENNKLKVYMNTVLKTNEDLQMDIMRMKQQLEQAGFFVPPQQQFH